MGTGVCAALISFQQTPLDYYKERRHYAGLITDSGIKIVGPRS